MWRGAPRTVTWTQQRWTGWGLTFLGVNRAHRADVVGALSVLLATSLFFAMWWNRVLAPMGSSELEYITALDAGILPYRDYFFHSPPGFFLLWLPVARLCANNMAAIAFTGVVLRIGLALALYGACRTLAGPTVSAIASVVACLLAATAFADAPQYYNQITSGIAGLICLTWAIGAGSRSPATGVTAALLTGLLVGFNALLKQTTGGMVLIVVVALALGEVLLTRRPGWAARLGGLGVGIGTALGAGLLWLVWHGLLYDCLDASFVSGPAAKGSLVSVLLRPVLNLFWWYLIPENLVTAGICLSLRSLRPGTDARGRPGGLALILVGLALGVVFDKGTSAILLGSAGIAFFGMLLAMFEEGLATWRAPVTSRSAPFLRTGVFAIAAASAYGLQVSWMFAEMVVPGFALYVAWCLGAMEHEPDEGRRLGRRLAFASLAVVAVLSLGRKVTTPYVWGYWSEPPLYEARGASKLPALAGMNLSATTVSLYDNVTEAVVSHSRPGDTLLVYPHMQGFYTLTDRRPVGDAIVHWFDTCPDALALSEAAKLRAAPPPVVVALVLPPEVYDMAESLYRNGRRSGQRELWATIEEITAGYELVYEQEAPGSGFPVRVWARPGSARSP